MLTKEQIRDLRAWASVAVEDCAHDAKAYDEMNPGFSLPGNLQRKMGAEWGLIGEALSAYSRVAALLASKVAPGCFGLLTERTISCDELRRALEG